MKINNLVETHCHILPQIDDGSPNVETSLQMIEKLKNQGAKKIVLTPHFYTDSISLNDFVQKRSDSLEELMEFLPPDSGIELIPAAEVYITKYLFNYDNLDALKIGNSNYVLIEHNFSCNFGEDTYNRLMNLYCDYGVLPVLAHIERYQALMENEALLDDYIAIGCLTQVNISSFSNSPRSIRKRLIKYLDSGRIHIIGSDCHNLTTRAPDYSKGSEMIIKKCGSEALDTLIQNANNLIANKGL